MATPDTFEASQKELEEIITGELANCGTQQQTIKEECDRILEQAKVRVEGLLEIRRKEQEKKEAQEKKIKEQEEKAQAFIKELTDLVEKAEASFKKVEEEAAPFELDKKENERTQLEFDKVKEVAQAIEVNGATAKAAASACTSFILEKGPEVKETMSGGPPVGPGALNTAGAECKKALAALLQRINVCGKSTDAMLKEAKVKKEEASRGAAAKKKAAEIDALFKKHDKDSDEALSQTEATSYAKSELKFPLDKALVEKIWKCAVEPGQKGISKDKLHLLNTSVGIAKELQRDKKRRSAREAKEKFISGLQDKLHAKAAGVEKIVLGLEKKIVEVEEKVKPLLSKVKGTPAEAMLEEADACEKLIKSVMGEVSGVNSRVTAIPEGFDKKYEDDLRAVIKDKTKPLEIRMKRTDMRLARAVNLAKSYREKAARKTADSVQEVREFALALARHHAKSNSLTIDELFSKVDSEGDGQIDKTEFQKFFDSIDHEIKEPEKATEAEASEEKPAEAAEQPKAETSEEKPTESAEATEATKATEATEADKATAVKIPVTIPRKIPLPEEKKETPAPKKVDLTPEALSSFFSSLLEENSTTLSQDVFRRLLKVYYKVVKETPLTTEIEIKADSTVRQLKADEVLELVSGPQEEATAKVMRVQVKALADGAEGWATLASNLKLSFLQEVGPFFKTLVAGSLTDSFEDATPKEDAPKLHEGAVVEVLEWPKKHEESGLTRMLVKARVLGAVGWLTQTTKEDQILASPL